MLLHRGCVRITPKRTLGKVPALKARQLSAYIRKYASHAQVVHKNVNRKPLCVLHFFRMCYLPDRSYGIKKVQ